MSILQRLSAAALLLVSCSVSSAQELFLPEDQVYAPDEPSDMLSRRLDGDDDDNRDVRPGRRRRRRSEPITKRPSGHRRRDSTPDVSDGRRRRGVDGDDDSGRRRRRRTRQRKARGYKKSSRKRSSKNTIVGHNGRLQVRDGKIVNERKEPIHLVGISLFWSQWSPYYTAGAVKRLAKDWKVSVVRAAMGVLRSGGYHTSSLAKKRELKKVETIVEAAIDEGIYVIVDWHVDGGDASDRKVFNDCKEFFTKMTKKYGKYDNVLWEPYNEPHRDTDWSKEIKPYHEKIIKVIRRYSDNIIMLGSQSWSQDVDEAARDPVRGDNLVYSLHFYAINHQEKYRKKAIKAIEKGLTLFANEWGVCAHYGGRYSEIDWDEVEEWKDLMDKYMIGNTHWALNDNDDGCSLLEEGADKNGDWDDSDGSDGSGLTKTGKKMREYTRERSL